MKNRITVLLVDDHKLFRAGLMALLQTTQYKEKGIAVLGDVEDGVLAIQECIRQRPDIVLLDVDLPTLDGAMVAQELAYHVPLTKIIVLSSDTSTDTVVRLVRNGVKGYVSKDIDISDLLKAIIDVHNGLSYLSPEASDAMMYSIKDSSGKNSNNIETLTPEELLTKREREILQLVCEERSNNEIANLLFISPRTVETHKRNILQKLKVKNVAGLVKYYIHHREVKSIAQ